MEVEAKEEGRDSEWNGTVGYILSMCTYNVHNPFFVCMSLFPFPLSLMTWYLGVV